LQEFHDSTLYLIRAETAVFIANLVMCLCLSYFCYLLHLCLYYKMKCGMWDIGFNIGSIVVVLR
ncbi:hypothetical protein MEN24_20425, partial [Dolichospermum sp. ST_sed10]|nr:hypothetical protein [Dolichospermum sp. ST_sed10]